MADFCRQCAIELWGPDAVEAHRDMAGISTPADTAELKYAVVLCEGCGPTQVDHEGTCVAPDCYLKHGAPQ